MWSSPTVRMVCILFGIISGITPVCSQPRLVPGQNNKMTAEDSKLGEDIQKVIDEIHLLSEQNSRSFAVPSTEDHLNLNTYYSILSNLYRLFQPLMREGFFDDLPKILVCLLSERHDCGLEAELTKTVSLEMGKPFLMFFSSLRSQTCGPMTPDGESRSFFGTYLNVGSTLTSAFSGFQQLFINMLSNLMLSKNLTNVLRSLLDSLSANVLHFLSMLLEIPVDYVRIALEFGIEVPSLDGQDTCQQGDLKQLIMWGLKHNVSWSFGVPLVDILLESFLPLDESLNNYPGAGCHSPSSILFQRSASPPNKHTDIRYKMSCDHQNLANINDTLCADVLMGLGNASLSLLTFCKALGSLNSSQMEHVWSNMCYIFQMLTSPLINKSSNCVVEDTQPSAVSSPLNESQLVPPSSPRRVAREASRLQQLDCNYSSWLNSTADAALVSFCRDNDNKEFVRQVCNNASLMKKLLLDQANIWLYGFCANSSADDVYMVSQFCRYEQWIDQPSYQVGAALLQFCISLDAPRLTSLICEHTGFFMLLNSNPDNWQLMPNCTNSRPPAPFPNPSLLQLDSCQYSEWHNVMQITTDILSKCILIDQIRFATEVCANKTFLSNLLQNKDIAWLETHCSTFLVVQPTEPIPTFDLAAWCDYHTWGERQVDDSVVGLCWQNDQAAFQENVCCKIAVFEKLLENPKNKWLTTVCTDMEKITVTPQLCRYTDWTHPIIVDMTELALCAEIDPQNFTSKVCANATVIQNLLANQDNAWLVQYCSNHSSSVSPPVTGGGQTTLTGFIVFERCVYSNWITSLPNATLLAQCWENDQANFVSSICPNPVLILLLSREPSTAWVSSMCTTFTNYTNTPTKNGTTTVPNTCASQTLMKQLTLLCPKYLIQDCQPCPSENMILQMMVRCWVESLSSRMESLLTTPVTEVLNKAVATTVVILLAVEDSMGPIWQVNNTIRQNVLASIVDFLKRETNQDKKTVLLQCFGIVLSNLLQSTRDMTSNEQLFIKEYFNLPLSSLRPVLGAAHISTVRLILQYYNRFKDSLQLSDEYQSTMVSVLLKIHQAKDEKLLLELGSLLAAASPTDIQALPSMLNINVRETINTNMDRMSLAQREAFGLWYSKVMSASNITGGHLSLIRDTGNLIAYLPFHSFQHLSAAQLFDGLDVLQRNTLSSLKQEFIADKLIGTYRNLTAQDFIRLGNLSCLADPEDLLVYRNTEAFQVIQENILSCALKGLSLPSQMVSDFLLNNPELQIPSSLSANRLKELAPLLPLLGATFLKDLTSSQLISALPALKSVPFTPIQASIIVDKLFLTNTLRQNQLQELGSLIVGVKTETLLPLTSDRLLSMLKALSQHTPIRCLPHKHALCAPEANAIATKLWGFPEVVSWLDDVEPLLRCTPLLSILPRTRLLVERLSNTSTKPWNTQQAQAIVKELININPDLIKQDFLSLQRLGQGLSCNVLKYHFQADKSPSSVRKILSFLQQQPTVLHTSLKKCVIEELDTFDFTDMLQDLGAEIALSIPVSTIKKFSADKMDTLRNMIVTTPQHFLMLSRTKQELLVDKIVQRMAMNTGPFTEEEFRSLGIMAPFVGDEVFVQLERTFFIQNLEYLKGLCYSSSKMEIVARMLQEPAVFGPVKNWNKATLSAVGRFLFFLPSNILQEISSPLMTVGRIERLFMSHRQWEEGEVGILCSDMNERNELSQKQQFVLQTYLGFLKINSFSLPQIVPTCEILRTTAPSAWTSSSLGRMSSSAFSNCLELMGQDPFLQSYQRAEVLSRVKKIYGPISSFSQSLIAQLGGIALEMSPEELSALQLEERRSIAAMGAISTWNNRQLTTLFTRVLNSTKRTPSQLDSSMLVALGHIVCGAKTTEIKTFNNVELSKAVLWLGQLRLSCSEEQMLALVELLTNNLAFGPMDSWGTDVFIEIGVLAAGLPDIAMSALVKEQIQGITPLAISIIPPEKFAAAFHQSQISMFSYEQAVAVTPQQLSALRDVQRTALAMVLTPWEDRPVVLKSRPLGLGLTLRHSPLCLILELLMLLIILF